jgi:hypothetical protein
LIPTALLTCGRENLGNLVFATSLILIGLYRVCPEMCVAGFGYLACALTCRDNCERGWLTVYHQRLAVVCLLAESPLDAELTLGHTLQAKCFFYIAGVN